jgi:hypothetical protein
MRFASVSVFLIALAGCAGNSIKPAPDNAMATDFAPPPKGALIVLLPVPQTEFFEEGERMMSNQVDAQLKAAGYRTAALTQADYDRRWAQEATAVGGVFDSTSGTVRPQAFVTALSSLAQHACAEQTCDLVIRPRMVARHAELGGSRATWDGVRKLIPLRNAGRLDYSFSGTASAISVELTVLTGQGAFAFRHYGGITLPHEADVWDQKSKFRTDLFDNDKDVAEGVRVALEPLLPPQP